ncbi:hypothetical protein ACSLOP_30030 [Escherichia coli]
MVLERWGAWVANGYNRQRKQKHYPTTS